MNIVKMYKILYMKKYLNILSSRTLHNMQIFKSYLIILSFINALTRRQLTLFSKLSDLFHISYPDRNQNPYVNEI